MKPLAHLRRYLLVRESVLLFVVAAVFTGFALRVPGFLDSYGLLERSRYWAVTGMVAVPMTFVIASGGIDLSVGSIVALCGVVTGLLHQGAGLPLALAAVLAVAVGFACGAANGAISSYVGIPPLVVTLATMSLYRGLAMGLSKARPFADFSDSFLWFAHGDVAGVPVPLLLLAVTGGLGGAILRLSKAGRFTECAGENPKAAAFAAIPVRRVTFLLYAACGLVCGIVGLVNTALYVTAKADTARGLELEAIACVVIGGTRISGGHGSIIGTLLGLLLIGILRHGLGMAGVASEHEVIAVGLLLVSAAVVNEWVAGRGGNRA